MGALTNPSGSRTLGRSLPVSHLDVVGARMSLRGRGFLRIVAPLGRVQMDEIVKSESAHDLPLARREFGTCGRRGDDDGGADRERLAVKPNTAVLFGHQIAQPVGVGAIREGDDEAVGHAEGRHRRDVRPAGSTPRVVNCRGVEVLATRQAQHGRIEQVLVEYAHGVACRALLDGHDLIVPCPRTSI